MRQNLVLRQAKRGTWSWGLRAIPCMTMQKMQETQKAMVTQGAAFKIDCSAVGQADMSINYYHNINQHSHQNLAESIWGSMAAQNSQQNTYFLQFILYNNTMRESRIENQLEEVRQLAWAQVIECAPKGIERDDLWVLWVPGRAKTFWEGGLYPVQINFPPEYPRVSPIVTFQPDFKHPHVYEGGVICLPLLESEYWRTKIGMCDILQRIVSLVHQDVNPYSPANVQVFKLSRDDPKAYQEMVREQAKKYNKKMEKYFHQPCIHINVEF